MLIGLIALLLPACLSAQHTPARQDAQGAVRTRYTIDDSWKFYPGGVNFAWSPSVSDAAWKTVSLPHTWNAHDPFDDVPSYRRGIGWYRKELHLDSALEGKRLFLYFEGANQVADVYVNGAFVGEHKGGYTAFAIDITDAVKFDGKENANLIAVKVDNSQNPYIPPLSVGYALYGGIYRDVWLIATDPVHFELTDHGACQRAGDDFARQRPDTPGPVPGLEADSVGVQRLSLRNSSATVTPRIAAMVMASKTFGSLRPRSMFMIVWRLTPARRASSSCDMPRCCR